KKEPRGKIAVRPKRVGYWKASLIIIANPTAHVHGSFCRNRSVFVDASFLQQFSQDSPGDF
ncbi:MAG: hypothetical protein RR426_05995, partial [Oscillospiraceae bacterium]